MSKFKWIPFLVLIIFFNLGCDSQQALQKSKPAVEKPSKLTQQFKDYWYQGVAELSTFRLQQARYGEIREGLATTVFVTEDFSKSRFVKLDYPEKAGDDKVSVLKFNLNKRFITGIYDYTLMQSVFKPVDLENYPNTFRVTTSNIEWCGQFLTNTRLNNDGYLLEYNSYFDGEEALKVQLPIAKLEDEIWNLIRIDPARLPVGETKLIPGILTQELTHKPISVENASCTLLNQDSTSIYTISYSNIPRKLQITFENIFPYRIVSWEETFETVSGWGLEAKIMTTKAQRIKYTLSDYWERKFLKDEVMRKEQLGIED